MLKNLRWGILGTARIASEQLIPAMKKTNGAEVYAVASRNFEKGLVFAQKHEIPKIYGNYDELLMDPEIDVVYIPLPNHLHAEWAIKAARHGKHVLCEKPIALNASQMEEMFTVSEEHHVLLMEAFMYQYHPQWIYLKGLIDQREIGDIKIINSSFSFLLEETEDIRFQAEMGGGSLYDLGCYCIHSTEMITNSPVDLCTANAEISCGVDHTNTATMKFKNGILAHFDCSFQVPNRQRFEVCGSEGSIVLLFPFRSDFGKPRIMIYGRNGNREVLFEDVNVYQLQIEHFQKCIFDQDLSADQKRLSFSYMKAIDELNHWLKR